MKLKSLVLGTVLLVTNYSVLACPQGSLPPSSKLNHVGSNGQFRSQTNQRLVIKTPTNQFSGKARAIKVKASAKVNGGNNHAKGNNHAGGNNHTNNGGNNNIFVPSSPVSVAG